MTQDPIKLSASKSVTLGDVFNTALKIQNLTNAEWTAFNAFFDEHDQLSTLKDDNPILFNALLRLKENQAKIETLDALNMFCSGNFDTPTYSESRQLIL